jgi:hypothetical protein
MEKSKKKFNSTKLNMVIDASLLLAFLFTMDPHTTGKAIHEWLSIAFGVAIIVHLLLHWEWIVAVTRRFLSKTVNQARTNYVLNALLFISMTVVIFSGIMISEVVLPTLGIEAQRNFFWRWLHSFSADAILFVIGLHVALHRKWIVNTSRRYLLIIRPGKLSTNALEETRA